MTNLIVHAYSLDQIVNDVRDIIKAPLGHERIEIARYSAKDIWDCGTSEDFDAVRVRGSKGSFLMQQAYDRAHNLGGNIEQKWMEYVDPLIVRVIGAWYSGGFFFSSVSQGIRATIFDITAMKTILDGGVRNPLANLPEQIQQMYAQLGPMASPLMVQQMMSMQAMKREYEVCVCRVGYEQESIKVVEQIKAISLV